MYIQPTTQCKLSSFFLGVVEVCFMSAPVGECDYCCQRNDAVDIQYKLFTRSNPTTFQLLSESDNGLSGTNFNKSHLTVIYLFGFSEAATGPSTIGMRDGVVEVCFMSAPVGECDYCCQRNDAVDIQYKLFTRSNPTTFQLLSESDNGLSGTNFNKSHLTVIYLFGFSEAATGPSTIGMRDAHLSRGDYNFISVDWSRLIAFPWYVTAVKNTRYMGQRLAEFIQFLHNSGIPASTLHVIGFSLGAEAAGFTGKALKSRGIQIGRITGLDPAYPGYALNTNDGHLAKGDAAFVDVIHTNPGIFGFPQPLGDVDFYPNPGSWIQNGCWIDQLIKNKQGTYFYGCSHNRAWRYYAESVRNPQGFPATFCRDWRRIGTCKFTVDGYMGISVLTTLKGILYLETNQKPPFAKNGP